MNKQIVKYTQWFTISSLDELTSKTFEAAIEKQKKYDELVKKQLETFNHFQEL